MSARVVEFLNLKVRHFREDNMDIFFKGGASVESIRDYSKFRENIFRVVGAISVENKARLNTI